MPGRSVVAATRQPASKPPPPTGITSASRSGASSSSSSASVPWPAITAGRYRDGRTPAAVPRQLLGMRRGFRQRLAVQHHGRAPGGGAGDLGGGREGRHDDGRGDAGKLRMARHRLRVVARRHRDDAARLLVLAQHRQAVGRAAFLEGAGDLQVVELQRHGRRRLRGRRRRTASPACAARGRRCGRPPPGHRRGRSSEAKHTGHPLPLRDGARGRGACIH